MKIQLVLDYRVKRRKQTKNLASNWGGDCFNGPDLKKDDEMG